jgi:transcription elongation factor GreA
MKPMYLTKAGYEKMRAELDELKSNGRQDVAKAIAEARDKGDLSENAEYDAAKDAQSMLEAKISEIETALASVRLIDESTLDASKAGLLTNVTIRNTKNGMEKTYKLVPESEADLKTGKISINSPMGQGLLGKTPGEQAVVKTPAGDVVFEIKEISIG